MGVINAIKKLVGTQKKKKEIRRVGEAEGPQPKQFQHKTKQFKKTKTTKSTPVDAYSSIIKDWERQVQLVKQHPLSQIRIINQTLLETLTDILKRIDIKLENLSKLDEIIEILKTKEKELEREGVETKEISEAIRRLENITFKDKQVLGVLEKEEKLSANQMAKLLNITRSTASLRLNKLYEMGVLEKEAKGRNILFKIKKD